VIFDVNETLSDLQPLADAFAAVGLAPAGVEPWFAGVLRDGMALASVGENRPFADVASDSLRIRLADGGHSDPEVERGVDTVMESFRTLQVHEDVVAGVQALRDLGLRLVTLSNGSTSVAEGLLERAGIGGAFERLLSVEGTTAWKPHPDAYAYALAECESPPGEAMLVAVHPWDIHGAARAGLSTCWLNRAAARYPSYFRRADVEVPDLPALANALR
jgi:2-haloacid dehalogenase